MKKALVKEIFIFGLAGVVAYFVDVAVTTYLAQYVGVYAARIPAFVVAATVTWIINRQLTFKDRQSVHSNIWKEYAHYLSLMVFGVIVNYVVYAISISFISGNYAILICVALGSLAGMAVNFITSRKFIFKKPIE